MLDQALTPCAIQGIHVYGNRVFVSDAWRSITVVALQSLPEPQFSIIADDAVPRLMTCCAVGHDSCFGGDKLGNIFELRLPLGGGDVEGGDDGGRGARLSQTLWEISHLGAAPLKVPSVCGCKQ